MIMKMLSCDILSRLFRFYCCYYVYECLYCGGFIRILVMKCGFKWLGWTVICFTKNWQVQCIWIAFSSVKKSQTKIRTENFVIKTVTWYFYNLQHTSEEIIPQGNYKQHITANITKTLKGNLRLHVFNLKTFASKNKRTINTNHTQNTQRTNRKQK